MTKEQVFEVVKDSIVEFLPDVSRDDICIEESLRDLGANSIDRMDIVIKSMEALGIKIPMVEFGKVKNIQGLVDLLYDKKAEL